MKDLIVALGVVLVVEGVLFAASPSGTKDAMRHALDVPDNVLRVIGLASAVAGVVVVWLIRG